MTVAARPVTWLKLGAVLEVLALAAIAVLWVLDLVDRDGAESLALKGTLVIVVLAVSGGMIGALLGRAQAPKA